MKKNTYKSMSMVLCFTILLISMMQAVPAKVVHAAAQKVTMDKPVFVYGQPITLSYTGATKKDWIGLYKKGAVQGGSNPSLAYKYASAQPNGSLTFTNVLKPGDYEALYMENDGYNLFERVPFSIITLNPPTEISFVDTDSDAAQLAGDVKIKSPSDQSNVTNYMLYWGNDVGKLPSVPAIAALPPTVTGSTYAIYTFPADTVIPSGATRLLAYSNSAAGETTANVTTAIPGLVAEKPNASFEVITDMHITSNKNHTHNKNIEDALKDIIALNPDSDGLMAVGDNTDNGKEAEYLELSRIFNLYKKDLPEPFFVQGNHDVRWGDWSKYSDYFSKYTNMKSNYYDTWIKGYHFIFLGTEKGLKDYSYLSDTQLKWLDEKLSEDEAKNKPVFIFHHQPLKNTVAGANDGFNKKFYWYGVRQDKELKTILAKHPQSILFSGHTHWELGSKDTMYNAKYATMFNAAATSYLWTDDDTSKEGSQGYFVEVYDDKVLVKGRDFQNDSWITNAQFEVNLSAQIPVVDPAIDPDLTISNPTVKMVKESYVPADPVQVAYTSSVREDWIGIYPTGTKLGLNVQAIAKQKTNSVKQPDGTMTFAGLNLAPGKYDAVYVGEAEYKTDNDNIELGRVTFEIVSTPQQIDVTGVQLDKQQLTLNKGETAELVANVMPEQATNKNVTWSTSDDTIARVEVVDGRTIVHAIKAGIVDITVTTADGNFKAVSRITIVEPPTAKYPFIVERAALATNTALVDATVTLKPIADLNTAVVVFQLMKGDTPISIASYQAQIPDSGGTFNVKFNANRKDGYHVNVLILSDFSADLTNMGTVLAEPVTLK
ncbi:Ig-like domain-containing protein [Bacillus sp. FJAT-28004]|uniref:Ig-like domain-containing protein n=1 Tax=Bacillus sp. FJAT-28004 TaxID=1679165 RepID=UPI000B098F84|nr:Ig-like domain-containing protein [Bacillus sp. FJAT-28004]